MLSCTTMLSFGASVSSRAATFRLRGSILLGSILLGCGASHGAPDPAAEAPADGDEAPDVSEPTPPAATTGGDPAAEKDPDPPPAGVYRGTYFVPVPPELERYARFELESVRVERRGDELGLQYDLPELLLGEARGLSFRGDATAAGDYRLEGDDGVATCQRSSSGWRCDEVLNRVELDRSKIDRLLEPMSDAEARARLAVADRFSIDPIGVLDVELSPPP